MQASDTNSYPVFKHFLWPTVNCKIGPAHDRNSAALKYVIGYTHCTDITSYTEIMFYILHRHKQGMQQKILHAALT